MDQPAPSPSPSADPELARAKDAARLLTARTLAEVIAAQARVAQDELAALDDQVAQLAADENDIVERLAALQKAIDERRANPDRIARDALRLAAPDPATAPPNLNDFQLEAFDELTSLVHELHGLVRLQPPPALMLRLIVMPPR